MRKYDGLGEYLRIQRNDEVSMTFAEIERVIGAKLPSSAYEHRPWWSNNGSNSVMTKVWLNAGFRSARVDMKERKLVFERVRPAPGVAEEIQMFTSKPHAHEPEVREGPHPLIGAMKGTFTIEPGWDLTKPALDPEELAAWEANLDRKADLFAGGLITKSK